MIKFAKEIVKEIFERNKKQVNETFERSEQLNSSFINGEEFEKWLYTQQEESDY